MDIFKASKNISKTIKSVSRTREIIAVFTRHGFEEFVVQGSKTKIPIIILPKTKSKILEALERDTESSWQETLGYRLRLCFEELGPAFIKFGQLLSSREDLFDEGFINEMKKLRDKVKPVPYEVVSQIIEESFDKSIDETFDYIDPNPIGTASIGVVYSGRLKSGEEVVVKVRRPNIEKMLETDFSILLFLVSQVERNSKELKSFGLTRIIKDFAASMQSELNFHSEAKNCKRFKENLAVRDTNKIFYVPKIFEELTTDNVMVMERLIGIPFSDQERIAPVVDAIHDRLQTGLQFFLKSFLQDGFFHADLHGGNFFFLENKQIGIIDFGLMGSLGRRSRKNFIAIIYSLLTFNYENLVYEFLDVADYDKTPDVDLLINDVKSALSPYVGLTVKQTNYSEVFRAVVSTLSRHELYLPRDWFIVFRSLMTLDGVGKSLNMDIDIFGMLDSDIKEIITSTFDKNDVLEEVIWSARDILPMLRIAPRYMKWFLKDFAKKNYRFEVNQYGYQEELKKVAGSINFCAYSVVASVLFYGGVSRINEIQINSIKDFPTLSIIFWLLSFLCFYRGIQVSQD